MDPILLPTLFDLIDLLARSPAPISIQSLQNFRRTSDRRFKEISRVLEALGIAHRENSALIPNEDLSTFVRCWNKAELPCLNNFFCRYEPYKRFLYFLEHEKWIKMPSKTDKEGRNRLGVYLKDKANLTFVAVDTFKWWGMAVGYVYISHIGDRSIYWGGRNCSSKEFEESLLCHYREICSIDGYANVGHLADKVCRHLNIAFIHFEALLGQLCRNQPRRYITSTSLARRPSTRSPVQTIRPRLEAKQIAQNLSKPIEWTEKRFIEDGILIGGRSVKMVKIHSEPII